MSQTLEQQLIYAADAGNIKAVEHALQAGADIHAHDDWALQIAARYGHFIVVELLLKSGADIHAKDDFALRIAAYNGHKEVVELLLKSGADFHVYDDVGVQDAASAGHTAVVELLLKTGADLTALLRSRSDLNKKQLTDILKQHAATACRGLEAVMMIDPTSRMKVLCHIHPEIKPTQIRDEIAMMQAMGLSPEQMGEMWKEQHGTAPKMQEVAVSL